MRRSDSDIIEGIEERERLLLLEDDIYLDAISQEEEERILWEIFFGNDPEQDEAYASMRQQSSEGWKQKLCLRAVNVQRRGKS